MTDTNPTFTDKIRHNPLPFLGIVLGNLIPLIGVLEWDWSLFTIFYLYWMENVIIGVFSVTRMLMAGAREGLGALPGAIFMSAFFTVHYGMFCMGHGMIMTEIFYADQLTFELTETNLFLIPWLADIEGFVWALVGIIFVEVIYNVKAIYDDRTQNRNTAHIMFAPYGRIIILHLTIILGGGLSLWLGFPPAALAFLIVLKIIYDLGLYGFEPKPKDKNTEDDKDVLA